MALEGLKRRILGSVGLLKGKREVDEETVRELTRSLRRALLEADFNVRQAKELTERIERRLMEEEPRPGIKLDTHAMNLIYTELVRLLGPAREIKPHNETVLMVGLYGQGKTTTTAKVAEWWRREARSESSSNRSRCTPAWSLRPITATSRRFTRRSIWRAG